ncbi:NADAR family protein [Acinetobacter piscicola]|uniref:NADAR family protein n=2 Tax=Moraxellaceae TaxID=468 RepID=A0A7S6VXF4_9GAMM|nr:NADAR family protein [Acinetobacter piscicola]
MTMTKIKFYSTQDEFGEFSNFAHFPIKLDGKIWHTTEHYFQAQKFADPQYQEKIRAERSPMIAARLGRDRKQKLRNDWESIKNNVMKKVLIAKFTQHEDLKNLLISTGEAKLIEHTENDAYWGDGGDGKGKNWLGLLLMQVRKEIAP